MTHEESAESAADRLMNAINVLDLGRARDVVAVPYLLKQIAKTAKHYYELAQTEDAGIPKEDAAVVALIFSDLANQVSPAPNRKTTTQPIYRESLAWALDKLRSTGELTEPEIAQIQTSFRLNETKPEIHPDAYTRYTSRINQGALTDKGQYQGYGFS
ncbi:MAG: hypothetical protein ACN2B6_07765 [Rickettsiales bacterium]